MSNDATNHYADVFKTWPVKQLGPKPTADQLDSIHKLGARPGKQALAIAMGLRDCGVTAGQIIIACGAPQLNKMRGFIADAMLKRPPVPKSPEGHTVYKLELTPKGLQRIKRTEAVWAKLDAAGAATSEPVMAKPVKVKAGGKKPTSKQRKPRTALPAPDMGNTEVNAPVIPDTLASADLLPTVSPLETT